MKPEIQNRRQVLYWRLLAATFNYQDKAHNFERMAIDISDELKMPRLLLDGRVSVDDVLHRHPELAPEFELDIENHSEDEKTLRKALIISKLLLNAFGEHTQGAKVTGGIL